MLKSSLKIVGIVFFITIAVTEGSNSTDQKLQLDLAKRSLVKHERAYLKTQPLSEDLRAFIERYKRKDKRQKRSQKINEDNLYIINNGQLVPVKTVKNPKRSEEEEFNNEVDAFTVVPLVIPLGPKRHQISKLIKTRTLEEEAENIPLKSEGQTGVSEAPLSQAAPTPKPNPESPSESNIEETANDDNTTKEETQVLHKILEDVEGLMQWKHQGNKKEGIICNLNGSWISDAAGMRFDICYQNTTRKKFRIHVADRIPPNEDGFLCDGNWTLFGELPFSHSGLVIVLAVHPKDKHIATFIGECRVCEGSESVTGTWLIGRSSRDCKDQKASHKILSDIWKREEGHLLRKKHLQKLGLNTSNEDD